MAQKTTTKRKPIRKPKLKEYELAYHLELPANVSIDEFVDKLTDLVESMGGYIGGGAVPCVEGKNGKERRPPRSAN